MRLRTAATATALLTLLGVMASFAPAGATDTPGHAITVTPSTGLSGGQVVAITGTGFTETPQIDGGWAIVECRAAILDETITLENALAECDVTTQPFEYTTSDSAGNITASYAVRPTITITSGGVGPVDCTAVPCAILVAQITNVGFAGAAAPISFGPPPQVCEKGDRPGRGYGDRHHCHHK